MNKIPRNQYRISITSGCNMKCVYCHNEGNKIASMLTVKQISKIISESLDLGLEEIRLTGGDPLTHPDILEICRMIKEDYGLRVGINTNCILINKLKELVANGWIDRIVVGLDYYDGKISKNSPIGVSSKQILNNILELKQMKCDISIATVFNNNYDEISKIVKWGIKNKIRIKIIEEEKNEIHFESSKEFIEMQNRILKEFSLNIKKDNLNEIHGYYNHFKNVSFFPSFCRLRRCDLCRKIQLRITSNGIVKHCLHYDNQDVYLFEGDVKENLLNAINESVDYHMDKELIKKEMI